MSKKAPNRGTKPNRYVRTQVILEMAMASALHFAGFELARNGTIALFTSDRTGFSSPSAAPLSTVCVTPFSFLLLWVYTKSFHQRGPRQSLRYSALLFALLVAVGAFVIQSLEKHLDYNNDQNSNPYWAKFAVQATVFLLNVIENGFVQLLATQHWSFLGSLCDQDCAVWFAPIAGLGSIASTLAAMAVSLLVDRVGLTGLLWIASGFLVASCVAADEAYRIAQLVCSMFAYCGSLSHRKYTPSFIVT
jgi:hypothetical protein